MFGLFKNVKGKLTAAVVRQQLKKAGLSDEAIEKILKAVEENPEFFAKIGKEIKDLQDKGSNQMHATMVVMKKYQAEFAQLLQGITPQTPKKQ